MRKLFLPFIVIAAIISSACITPNTPPPTLSPAAQLAYHSHQVQKVLDLIRDTAVDANAQKTTDGKQLLDSVLMRATRSGDGKTQSCAVTCWKTKELQTW
jgi:hypothetical protein